MKPETKKKLIFISYWIGVIACAVCLGLLVSKTINLVVVIATFNPIMFPAHYFERLFVIIILLFFDAVIACALLGAIVVLVTCAKE